MKEISKRELEVLEQVKEGYTNPQVAEALGISSKTVENHVRSILFKLKANNRTQAIVAALKLRILEL